MKYRSCRECGAACFKGRGKEGGSVRCPYCKRWSVAWNRLMTREKYVPRRSQEAIEDEAEYLRMVVLKMDGGPWAYPQSSLNPNAWLRVLPLEV